MNILIILAIAIANIIAIALIYQFVKKMQVMEKTIFIAVSFAIIYILVSITYGISGIGIDSRINEAAKEFITFIFVPVNVIILVPFIASKYNKLKFGEISKEEFIKRLVVVGIVGIIILTIEGFYFKNVKENIKILNNTIQQNSTSNDENEQNLNSNDKIDSVNQIETNTIKNDRNNEIAVSNEIHTTNSITNQIVNVLE